jgi:hypothetical protein
MTPVSLFPHVAIAFHFFQDESAQISAKGAARDVWSRFFKTLACRDFCGFLLFIFGNSPSLGGHIAAA